jgi:hypothetical protein
MTDLAQQIARTSEEVVAAYKERTGGVLDYSEASLAVVEEMLEEVAAYAEAMTPEQLQTLSQNFACYIIEVGRRAFGGRYCWYEQRDQPVLVVGEPTFRVALLAGDKVRDRLTGDRADNIPFFYNGFAERVRRAEPGIDALYV